MAKPNTLPRWATDQTNNDAPSSTQQDTQGKGWDRDRNRTTDEAR